MILVLVHTANAVYCLASRYYVHKEQKAQLDVVLPRAANKYGNFIEDEYTLTLRLESELSDLRVGYANPCDVRR